MQPWAAQELQTASIVAWRLLWVTYEAGVRPEQPRTVVLDEDEWQALAAAHTRSAPPPAEPPILREVVRWIGQLGGFLARKGDGEPGVKTRWQGMQRLHDLTTLWRLTRPPHPPSQLVGNV